MGEPILTTPRLVLRGWQATDRVPFAEMSQDEEVMRYFPGLLSRTESDAQIEKMQAMIEERGWGFWVVERRKDGAFIGLTGLNQKGHDFPNGPLVEIGWRVARRFWRRGYALEAASAALRFAFEELNLKEVYAFTVLDNTPSRQLMRRLGLNDLHCDFDHPALAEGDPLCRHCLYMISAEQWRARPPEQSGRQTDSTSSKDDACIIQ